MKKFLFRLLFLSLLLSCNIQELFATETNDYHLAVWDVNGKVTTFNLSEKPKVSFDDGVFKLSTISSEIEFKESSVLKFTLTTQDIITTVDEIRNKTSVSWNNNTLELKGFFPDSVIAIYTITGQKIYEDKFDDKGELLVDLNAYIQHIFIVQTNDVTFKIIKK